MTDQMLKTKTFLIGTENHHAFSIYIIFHGVIVSTEVTALALFKMEKD